MNIKEMIVTSLTNLIKIKSLVTLAMTAGMLLLLSGRWQPSDQILSLYCTSYGAVMTYYFTKKDTKASAVETIDDFDPVPVEAQE